MPHPPFIMRILVLFLLCTLSATAEDESYKLGSSLNDLSKNFVIPSRVLDGPFQLEATLTLHRLEGTAASVRFGSQLNIGFDGRDGSLFAEGGLIGKTISLAPAKDHLQAKKPFTLRAVRDEDGHFAVSIDDKPVFETDQLQGKLGQITIRPHRNTLDLQTLTLSGAIEVPEPGLTLQRRVLPILTDGEPQPILDFTLVLDRPGTLTEATVELHTPFDPAEVSSLTLREGDTTLLVSKQNQAATRTLTGSTPLSPGHHQFQLFATLRSSAPLHQPFNPTCLSLSFSDGSTIVPSAASLPSLQLAHRIHKTGDHNCHTFRIPGLARANDGSLLAVYDMRYNSRKDLQEHIDIGLSRSTDGGQTWTAPTPIMDMGEHGGKPESENGCSDPNILVDKTTGEVFVTAVWTHGKPNTHQWVGTGSEPGHDIHKSSQFMMVRSADHGRTWTKPENLTTRLKDPAWFLFAPAPGNGITLPDGTLVIPSQGRDAKGLPFSNIMWSKDHGKSWTVSPPARTDTTESSVALLSDQSLLLNMRDNRNRRDKSDTNGRALATTKDLGATWAKHPADHSALIEPTCMASMISHRLPDGRHVLFFSNPRDKHSRRNMTIQVSFDDGHTWPRENHLLLDQGTGYGYSSLTLIDDQTLGILYESSQADMTFQAIPLSRLIP